MNRLISYNNLTPSRQDAMKLNTSCEVMICDAEDDDKKCKTKDFNFSKQISAEFDFSSYHDKDNNNTLKFNEKGHQRGATHTIQLKSLHKIEQLEHRNQNPQSSQKKQTKNLQEFPKIAIPEKNPKKNSNDSENANNTKLDENKRTNTKKLKIQTSLKDAVCYVPSPEYYGKNDNKNKFLRNSLDMAIDNQKQNLDSPYLKADTPSGQFICDQKAGLYTTKNFDTENSKEPRHTPKHGNDEENRLTSNKEFLSYRITKDSSEKRISEIRNLDENLGPNTNSTVGLNKNSILLNQKFFSTKCTSQLAFNKCEDPKLRRYMSIVDTAKPKVSSNNDRYNRNRKGSDLSEFYSNKKLRPLVIKDFWERIMRTA